MAPPDADADTPSSPSTDDANASSGNPENGAFSSFWNLVMNIPYEQVELDSISLTLDSLHGPDASNSAFSVPGPPHLFALPPPPASPPLNLVPFPPGDLDQILYPSPPVDSFGSIPPVLDRHDPTASSSPLLLFFSPRSGDQDIIASSSLATTTPALLPSVDLLPEPVDQLAGQTLLPVYSPPRYVLRLPSPIAPPFSQNSLIVELPLPPVVQHAQVLQVLPPSPSPPLGQTLTRNDFTDGGRISNALSSPIIVTHITHINRSWTYIFLHAWHAVFHDTHTSFPPSNLVQLANRALSNAYIRWEQQWPNEPLSPAPITIGGIAMTAIRDYNAPLPIKPLLILFNCSFKGVVRLARQAAMNHLMRCTLGALVTCQVVPFLPAPHVDIRPSQSSTATIVPRVYHEHQKTLFEFSAEWDPRFGCRIWHKFEGENIIWFGNEAIRLFLATLLSPDEDALFTLGVRQARRGPPNVVTLWGPLVDLDNDSVLALLAKTLASLSTSVLGDVAQRPRQFPLDQSDGHRNRAVNKLTQNTYTLLKALDDLTLPYSTLLVHQRRDGHSRLIHLKEELGFRP